MWANPLSPFIFFICVIALNKRPLTIRLKFQVFTFDKESVATIGIELDNPASHSNIDNNSSHLCTNSVTQNAIAIRDENLTKLLRYKCLGQQIHCLRA